MVYGVLKGGFLHFIIVYIKYFNTEGRRGQEKLIKTARKACFFRVPRAKGEKMRAVVGF